MQADKLTFYKYQGAGNDFILIDNRNGILKGTENELFKHLCDRRFGIGADGLMLLGTAPGLDFTMYYANADGREGSMCGNGGRCIVAFAKKLGIIDSTANFSAVDGLHSANISGDIVSLKMIDVPHLEANPGHWVANTGSPHYVSLVSGLSSLDVFNGGRAVRNSDLFRKEGINVNFVEAEGSGYFVRTFERGVEDETLACGTGVTAVALAMADSKKDTGSITTDIRTLGGKLRVSFTRESNGSYHSIFLEGEAVFVYEGQVSY